MARTSDASAADADVPPPESQGGWRPLAGAGEIRELGGMDPARLDVIDRQHEMLLSGDSYGVAIVRHGRLVREFHSFNVEPTTRFDVWSCTKSFTGTAWGLLIDDARRGELPAAPGLSLETPIYEHIPAGHPLTDPRKARITVGHLLTMTSGIAGEDANICGIATDSAHGSFEFALGRCANRFGTRVDRLAADPGTRWDYSDPAFAHLTLAFAQLAGRELDDYLDEHVLAPIGIERLSWSLQGGRGFLGPHANPHTGLLLSARELARLGLLMLRGGRWGERRLLPEWWVELATRPSQEHNPSYGYTWWVNAAGMWPGVPADAYAAVGYRSCRCYVVPSLDLVVARVGTGPPVWEEAMLMPMVVDAVLDA